jgi:glycerophosphoryl diester phosphodiesterase
MALAPENTLSSFQKAIELGVDMIELDLHLSKDNNAIVIHDKGVDRTTDGKGYVNDLTLEEIKKLNIEENEKIPVLQEVIDIAKGKCDFNIEIKDENALKEAIRIIKKNEIEDNVIVSSFIQEVLKECKEIDSRIKTAMLFVIPDEEYLELAKKLGVYALHVHCSRLDREYIDKANKFNLKIRAWGADDKESVEKMIRLDVDGIITNNPELIQ